MEEIVSNDNTRDIIIVLDMHVACRYAKSLLQTLQLKLF